MIKENLLIYDFDELFNLLTEIEENLSFKLNAIKKNEISEKNLKKYGSYIILSKNNINFE